MKPISQIIDTPVRNVQTNRKDYSKKQDGIGVNQYWVANIYPTDLKGDSNRKAEITMISTQKTITDKPPAQLWREVRETHLTARKFADRHYSRKTKGASHFMGPGKTLVLLLYDNSALFGWRVQKYRKDEQEGVECNIFRNEGPHLSSELILEAEKCALEKWPGARRFFTMVDSKKIRKKRDPGRCFRRAGWVPCGISKDRGLIILEKPLPDAE